MLITVRAYRHSDLDLMLLGITMGKNFSGFIRECLHCYLRGVPLRAGIPDIPFVPSENITMQSKSTGVMLKEDEDADVISVLKNIRYGYRNNFVKNIVRMFTVRNCIAAYADNETCFNFLMSLQGKKEERVITPVLPVPEVVSTQKEKSAFVPKPKFRSEDYPAKGTADTTPMTVPVAPAPTTVSTSPPSNDGAWGAEDTTTQTTPSQEATSTRNNDDDIDVLDMFAGIIGS